MIKSQIILFADVSGSSSLFKREGDLNARKIISQLIEMMRHAVKQEGGTVIKTIGDEIMSVFSSPELAVHSAISMQQSGLLQDHGLTLRIGIHTGEVIEENNDVYGEAVNDAAALVNIAKGKQIIISGALLNQLPTQLREKSEAFDHIQLKGSIDAEMIYRIQWESHEIEKDWESKATQMYMPAINLKHEQQLSIELTINDASLSISHAEMPFTIGRSLDQNLVINVPQSSRQHCELDYKRGKFVLIDRSSNGTFLCQGGVSTPIYLRREESPLMTQGKIHFTNNSESEVDVIHFRIK